MAISYRNHVWKTPTTLVNEEFLEADFSGADLSLVIFRKCIFKKCLFQKGNAGNVRFFSCHFEDCVFRQFDFRRIAVGADGGLFTNCKFEKSDFTGRHFEHPHFTGCEFVNCKLRGVNFNDASFDGCSFVGKIEDTTFNGIYHSRSTGFPPLHCVDFSNAILGEYVTFESCDLSTCTPPKGESFDDILYQIYRSRTDVFSTGSSDRIVIDD